MGPDAMILVFWMLSFKPTFSLSSFTFIKRLFSSSLSAIRVVSSAYLRLLIFLLAILIPACASSSPAFLMMYSANKLNEQDDNIQPWCTPFPISNQSVVLRPVLTVASWPAYRFLNRQVRWSGIPIFQNFPQFVVIHTVKGFAIVNKTEIDVFLELSCFFGDPADVGNLIFGSSDFSKTSLNIWKFTVQVLLKPGLENFEHYLPSIGVFSNESVLHIRGAEYWSFSFSISPSSEYSGLISFRMDWLDLLAVQGTLKSLLQHHNSKASVLRCSAFYSLFTLLLFYSHNSPIPTRLLEKP